MDVYLILYDLSNMFLYLITIFFVYMLVTNFFIKLNYTQLTTIFILFANFTIMSNYYNILNNTYIDNILLFSFILMLITILLIIEK